MFVSTNASYWDENWDEIELITGPNQKAFSFSLSLSLQSSSSTLSYLRTCSCSVTSDCSHLCSTAHLHPLHPVPFPYIDNREQTNLEIHCLRSSWLLHRVHETKRRLQFPQELDFDWYANVVPLRQLTKERNAEEGWMCSGCSWFDNPGWEADFRREAYRSSLRSLTVCRASWNCSRGDEELDSSAE